MSNLKTVEEHNQMIRDSQYVTRRTGCACPKCGEELIKPYPNAMLTSFPPQIRVLCEECGFTGHIYQ